MKKAILLFVVFTILSCDATVIKTAARVKPTYFIMGPYGYIADKISIYKFQPPSDNSNIKTIQNITQNKEILDLL